MEFCDERLETGVEEIDKTQLAEVTILYCPLKWVRGIKYINITNGGSGYGGNTTVTLGAVTGVVQPTTVIPTITNGSVSVVVISNPGQGYATTAPTVTINGTGTNATAEAVYAGGTFKFGENVHGASLLRLISDGVTGGFAVENTFTIRRAVLDILLHIR